MANNFKQSTSAVNAAADAVCALCNNGYIRLYTAAQPANADTALSSPAQTLLAELRFGATAFAGSVAGVAQANAITPDSSADNTGTAAWFRALKSDGSTVIFDGSVGTSGSDLNLNSTSISAGSSVGITSMSYTQPKS